MKDVYVGEFLNKDVYDLFVSMLMMMLIGYSADNCDSELLSRFL